MPLSPAQINEHLVRWRPLVVGLAYRFRKRLRPGHDFEDIVAIGMVALWRAAETWREDGGASFATYANRCVLYALMGEVKALNAWNRRVAYECRQSTDTEHENGNPVLVLRSEWRDPEAALVQTQTEQELKLAMDKLPPRLKHVLRQRFDGDQTLKEIGDELGVTRERARQLEAKAIDRLRLRVSA